MAGVTKSATISLLSPAVARLASHWPQLQAVVTGQHLWPGILSLLLFAALHCQIVSQFAGVMCVWCSLPPTWSAPGALPNLFLFSALGNSLTGALPDAWATPGAFANLQVGCVCSPGSHDQYRHLLCLQSFRCYLAVVGKQLL